MRDRLAAIRVECSLLQTGVVSARAHEELALEELVCDVVRATADLSTRLEVARSEAAISSRRKKSLPQRDRAGD